MIARIPKNSTLRRRRSDLLTYSAGSEAFALPSNGLAVNAFFRATGTNLRRTRMSSISASARTATSIQCRTTPSRHTKSFAPVFPASLSASQAFPRSKASVGSTVSRTRNRATCSSPFRTSSTSTSRPLVLQKVHNLTLTRGCQVLSSNRRSSRRMLAYELDHSRCPSERRQPCPVARG